MVYGGGLKQSLHDKYQTVQDLSNKRQRYHSNEGGFQISKTMSHMKNLKVLERRTFKLRNPNEGGFAFQSSSDLHQPHSTLKFKEHDLALLLQKEELEAKQKLLKRNSLMAFALGNSLTGSLQTTVLKNIQERAQNNRDKNDVKGLVTSTTADARQGIGLEAPIDKFTF